MSADIAIVGCGPAGALLGNLLGQLGLAVDIFEREREIYALPRAVHFDGEVMRIFQSVGLAGRMAGVARPSPHGARYDEPSGRTLMIRLGSDQPGPSGWPGNWYFHQPDLEAVLRDGLSRFPNVRLYLGHEVRSVDDLDARYVVGCDGARSLVRHAIGSRQVDLGLHQPWLVVDLLCDPKSPRTQALPLGTLQFCDPARPMTLVNVNGQRRRWEIMLMPGDDPARLTDPDIFWPMIARWVGPQDAVIERAAVYTFHSVVQEGWRKGRLLLAGDACHQTPPFLGQGMCTGLRDVSNLAWKLAAVVTSGASDSLLDTYESERLPLARAFVELAVRLGGIIQATDPAEIAARNARFAEGGMVPDFPQPQLGPGCGLGTEPPVGALFPQPDGRADRPALRHRGRSGPSGRGGERSGTAARRRSRLAGTARESGRDPAARSIRLRHCPRPRRTRRGSRGAAAQAGVNIGSVGPVGALPANLQHGFRPGRST